MDDESIELDKRAVVEQEIEPLARLEFAFRVLSLESLRATAEL